MKKFYKYLKLLDYKSYLKHVLLCFFYISCTVSQKEQPKNRMYPTVSSRSESYATQTSAVKSLTISQTELKNNINIQGFVWAPFILPIQNLTITNASLFLGIKNKNMNPSKGNASAENFIPPPMEGHCQILPSATETNESGISSKEFKNAKPKKLYTFVNNTKHKQSNTSLFFILDQKTYAPIAVARLNSNGKSQCLLPVQPYIISMGYGFERYRNEIPINGKHEIINLKFPHLSSLHVNPGVENQIQNGDIVRIGKKFNLDLTNQKNEFKNFHIAAKIIPDLYLNADMASHDFGVDEYLKTSFFIGQTKYQIELESGNYVVAILRKNQLICLNKITLKPDSSEEISCTGNNTIHSSDESNPFFASEDTIFDVGFHPQNLIKNKNFVSWSVATPGVVLFVPQTPSSLVTSEKNIAENKINDFFSFLFKDKFGSGFSKIDYPAGLSECIHKYKLPLFGMNSEQLFEGQVPFSEYIRVTSRKYSLPYFLNNTNVTYTNGAEIWILEPMLSNTGVLFATENQDFMVRLTVPKLNSTQVLEMYINNILFKRWILKRDSLDENFATTLSVNTFETKNFVVKFIARGNSPLSNFISGRELFLPFAETREFCVSIDGRNNCT